MDLNCKDFQIPQTQTIVQLKELKICQKQYIEEQRKKLKEEQESYRKDLQSIMTNVDLDVCKSGKEMKELEFNPMFKDILMISKWMMEEPKDLDDYILIPCPKGSRVSITRQEEKLSEVFSKSGDKIMDLRLNIPKNTQLDAIYNKKNKTFYILDVLWYEDHDMRFSDTAFRRYWIRSKFYELKIGVIDNTNEIKFSFLEGYEFTMPHEIHSCFQQWPLFEGVDTDGFLFYHKDTIYINGECEKVLWLFPYMVDEVLTMFRVNKDYNLYKPPNYTTYLDYIGKFNEKQKRKNIYKHVARFKDKDEKIDYQKSNAYSFDTTKKNVKERIADLDRFCRPEDGWYYNAGPSRRTNPTPYQDFTQDDFNSFGRSQFNNPNKNFNINNGNFRRGGKRPGNGRVHQTFLDARNRAFKKF